MAVDELGAIVALVELGAIVALVELGAIVVELGAIVGLGLFLGQEILQSDLILQRRSSSSLLGRLLLLLQNPGYGLLYRPKV